jgi:hypothetical protein
MPMSRFDVRHGGLIRGLLAVLTAALVALPTVAGSVQTASAQVPPSDWSSVLLSPPADLGTQVTINAESCWSAGNCVAVGSYLGSTSGGPPLDAQPLVETLSSGTWTASTPPVPTSINPVDPTGPPVPAQSSTLIGISCTSLTTCVAVGNYNPGIPHELPAQYNFATELSGGTWTTTPLTLTDGTILSLTGISCADATDCVTVGSGIVSSSETGIAYTLSSTGWASGAVIPLPVIGDPPQALTETLNGVWCISSTACTAVGYYQDVGSLNEHVVIETLSGTTWTFDQSLAETEPPGAISAELSAVSCTSLTLCQAVGSYTSAAGIIQALAESQTASGWVPTTDMTPDDSAGSSLSAVSCTGAEACVAAGSYLDSTDANHALTAILSGNGIWTDANLTDPDNSSNPGLTAVSCPDTGDCVGVGNATPTTGGLEPFAATEVVPAAVGFTVSLPATATPGEAVTMTVTAVTADEGTAYGYSGTVGFTSTDPEAMILPPQGTLSNGVGTFEVTFGTVGVQTVTATDTVNSSITGISNSVTVGVPAVRFAVTLPGTANVGSVVTMTVTAIDATGGTATDYTGTVAFTSSDTSAALPADSTLTGGTGTFNVTFETAGQQSVTATDTETGITGTSNYVTVSLPAFEVSLPGTATTGTPVVMGVTALTPGFTGAVRFTSSDTKAILPPPSALSNGSGTFHVTFETGGLQTVTAIDTGIPAIRGTSNLVTVTVRVVDTAPTAPTGLRATGQESGIALTWSPPASNGGSGITGYLIFRGVQAGRESATPVATTTATSYLDTTVSRGGLYFYVVKAVNAIGLSRPSDEAFAMLTPVIAAGGHLFAGAPGGNGYWLTNAQGGVFPYGGAGYYGSLEGIRLDQPIVTMASTADGHGYWLAASDGGVFAFGDAGFYGSLGNIRLNQPIVGMASTPDGHGYWLVAADGGVFAFGDAGFHGSTGGIRLDKPVVGMAATPDGRGYWLVATDGGVFSFGDAHFYGSTGGVHLAQPIVGMAVSPDGNGYWMVASDGGIFTFGAAGFYGSLGGHIIMWPILGMIVEPTGIGYQIVNFVGTATVFGTP